MADPLTAVLYEEMEDDVALRGRPAGGGFKSPRGALAKDCRAERRGKGAAVIASDVDREDERWVQVCPLPLKRRKTKGGIETGVSHRSRDESGGYPFTAQAVSGVQAA